MPYNKFSHDDFRAVRAAIVTSLNSSQLPDETIGLDIYAGEAARFVELSLLQQQIEANAASVATIAVYYAASLLAPSVQQVIRENIAGGEIQWQAYDGEKRAKTLRDLADGLILAVKRKTPVTTETKHEIPAMFGLAKARRRTRGFW